MPLDAIVNTGLGLALESHNDKRQLKQQEKLNRLGIEGTKELQKYGQGLALDTWEKTNYPAQVEQLKEAGLSTGLMYGGGGAGGTTQGGSGGSVSGGEAPKGGQEILGLQLMGAQKNLLEAQTEKTKTETENIGGVERNLTEQKGRMAAIEASLLEDSYENTLQKIQAEAIKLQGEARSATTKGEVDYETANTSVKLKEAELIGLGIANEQRRVQTELTQEQIKATIEAVKQKWAEVEISRDRLKLDQFVKDVADSTKLTVETVSRIIGTITKGK